MPQLSPGSLSSFIWTTMTSTGSVPSLMSPWSSPGGSAASHVGVSRLPVELLGVPGLGHHRERAALQRDDRPRLIVPVHAERLVGEDEALPHLDVFVLELGHPARDLLLGLFGCPRAGAEQKQQGERTAEAPVHSSSPFSDCDGSDHHSDVTATVGTRLGPGGHRVSTGLAREEVQRPRNRRRRRHEFGDRSGSGELGLDVLEAVAEEVPKLAHSIRPGEWPPKSSPPSAGPAPGSGR